MKKKTQDEVLEKVGMQLPIESQDFKHAKELEQKGLIKKNSENHLYSLTSYGKVVQVMGYASFEKTERLEKELPSFTPDKIKQDTLIILVIYVTVILGVILLLWNSDFINGQA